MKKITAAASALMFLALAAESRGVPLPTVSTPTALPNPGIVGQNVLLDVAATGVGLTYQWDFGDTTVDPVSGVSFRNHIYAAPGHYTVSVTVTDTGPGSGPITKQIKLVVHHPLTAVKPTNSSTIILDSTNNRIWVVNPDQDTVATMDTATNTVTEIPVGKNPRTVAQAADGTIWVVSQQHPSISVLSPTAPFALQHVIPLPHGSLPYGICMTPDGSAAYVSFQGSGGVWKISTATWTALASSTVPPSARGIAVTSDGRVLVTRFISPQSDSLINFSTLAFAQGNHGEVVELNAALQTVRTYKLVIDPGIVGVDPDFGASPPPSSNASRGVPNYLTSLVVTPDGRRAWVPSKKDNIQRGTKTPERDGRTPGPEVTYRAIVSSVDLVNNTEQLFERVDVDNSEMPQAACTSPLGDYIFIAIQGTNRIQIRDLFSMAVPLNSVGDLSGTTATNGLSPQGLVIDPLTKKLYVQNYMGRTVSVFDTTNILNGTVVNLPAPSVVVPTVLAADLLGATPLLGKQIFYNAGDPRMSLNGYVSCAGCHLDGGSDMRVWDFTNRTEGFRNTVLLQGRGNGVGMKHGNVHWSANFDEIQDFENDIQNAFGGTGFSGGAANPPMGAPNAARSANLDALASYVHSLTKVSRSPFRNADGTLTASAAAGEAVFKAQNCQLCHGGREFCDSTLFTLVPPAVGPAIHNVGTLKATSGKRLNQTLLGIDTPTLKGIWQTAPYFHDGSAATIMDVINTVPNTTPNAHAGMHLLSQTDKDNLARYMIEIDELDSPPVPAAQVNNVFLGAIASGRPYSLATSAQNGLPFVDRSYTITTALPAALNGKILLRTSEDDKNSAAASQVQFTVPAGTDVYVYYDSRATTLPTWLAAGWTPDVALTITPGLVMNGFKMTPQPPAGIVTLGGNQQGGPTGALRNYFVIISAPAPVFEEGPLSQGEWAHDGDGDGDGLHDEFEALYVPTNALISPWNINSLGAGVADEDQLNGGGVTLFNAQVAFEAVPPAGGGGGGGGGCGLGGLEFLIPMLALRLLRRRSKR